MIESLEMRLLLASVSDGTTLILNGTSGDDRIIVTQRKSTLIVRENDNVSHFPMAGLVNISFTESPGNDYVKINSSLKAALIAGDGNDTLIGGSGDDNLSGDAGNDLILGRLGNDMLSGRGGHDKVIGGGGNDLIFEQDFDRDTLLGGDGDDQAIFDPGQDIGSNIEKPTWTTSGRPLEWWEFVWTEQDGKLPQHMPQLLGRNDSIRLSRHVIDFTLPRGITPLLDPGPTPGVDNWSTTYASNYDAQFGAGGFNALFKFPNTAGKIFNWDFNAPPPEPGV
jgi:Ca2+-binding RTX toxin-like protein